MKDRQPTPGMEGRIKITPEDGSPAFYARIEMADYPLEKGTPIDTANLFSGQTQALYPDGTETVNDALAMALYGGWQEIAKFDVAGDYEWTSDFDGMAGVLVIGAGGRGAGGDLYATVSSSYGYLGGSSGYTVHQVFHVTKGSVFSISVGAGGDESGSAGSSSFEELTAAGGKSGGRWYFGDGSYTAIDGCQASYISTTQLDGLFGGVYVTGNADLFGEYPTYGRPWDCKNPFTGDRILGSGGNAIAAPRGSSVQFGIGGKNPLTGLGGGDAAAAIDADVVAEDGRAPGCGGGAAVSNHTVSGLAYTATPGKGADGAVIIYRKVVIPNG